MSHSSTLSGATRRYLRVLLVALFVVALDQLTKELVLQSFSIGELRPVVPDYFNLTLTFNPGAAFGLWSNLGAPWRELVLALTAGAAMFVVLFFLRHPQHQHAVAQIGLAAVLGGAIGNVIDRVRFGAVVDFLDFYVGTYHWPAFNVADAAICCGVAVLVVWPGRPAEQASSTT
jgi:signal peptidase II